MPHCLSNIVDLMYCGQRGRNTEASAGEEPDHGPVWNHRVVTLGKAKVLQPRPSSSSTSLTVAALHRTLNSVIRCKRLQIGGSPVMHIKTTKCNRFCLVASVTNRELFHHSEVQVTVSLKDFLEFD